MKFHNFGHEENLVEKINLPKIGDKTIESVLKCYGGFEYSASVVLFPYYKAIDLIKDVYYHISKKPHLHYESSWDIIN